MNQQCRAKVELQKIVPSVEEGRFRLSIPLISSVKCNEFRMRSRARKLRGAYRGLSALEGVRPSPLSIFLFRFFQRALYQPFFFPRVHFYAHPAVSRIGTVLCAKTMKSPATRRVQSSNSAT